MNKKLLCEEGTRLLLKSWNSEVRREKIMPTKETEEWIAHLYGGCDKCVDYFNDYLEEMTELAKNAKEMEETK